MPFITIQIYVQEISIIDPECLTDYEVKDMYINPELIATIQETDLFGHTVTEIGINNELFHSPMSITEVLKCVASGGDVGAIFLN